MSAGERTSGARINTFYDDVMYSDLAEQFNEGTHFQNYGYWTAATTRYREAAENLMGELADLAPPTADSVLDVACGQGATTRWWTRHYPGAEVTGVNISEKQLETCRTLAPNARFLLRDATDLQLPSASVDLVSCVEAAFHFDTREDFLAEARRVLRPGGRLVLTDILFRMLRPTTPYPGGAANQVADLEEYRELLADAGFTDIRVVDATEQCWRGFLRACRSFAAAAARDGRVPGAQARDLLDRLARRELITRHYVLAGATRARRR